MNVQIGTDLTAARTHQIIRICERQGVLVLANPDYQGANPAGAGRKP
ncbi:hypothetical protein [Streptomyces sp. NBC_00280]